jgi:hypothetical protein
MLRSLVYVVIFAAGAFAGGSFPAYFLQYQQHVNGQFDQVTVDLGPFQEIADRYHGGSLDALVDYHLASTDPTFHDEGIAIRTLITNRNSLAETRAAFAKPAWRQAAYLFANADERTARSTWENYTPTLVTTPDAIIFALSIGLVLMLACMITLNGLRLGLKRLFRRNHA